VEGFKFGWWFGLSHPWFRLAVAYLGIGRKCISQYGSYSELASVGTIEGGLDSEVGLYSASFHARVGFA
jgi:hypothetical protein